MADVDVDATRLMTLTCSCGARNERPLPYDMLAPDKCYRCEQPFKRAPTIACPDCPPGTAFRRGDPNCSCGGTAVVLGERATGMRAFPGAVHGELLNAVAAFCISITASRPPNQDIGRKDNPYIDRWFLARKAKVPVHSVAPEFLDLAPFMASELENLYLHRYHRGDADEPHDHPWANASLVVRGWYRESVYTLEGELADTVTRQAGDIVLRTARSVHAILETSDDCLSLFATLPKEREWGFYTAEGWVPWREFRG